MRELECRPNRLAFLGTVIVWSFLFVLFSFASLLPQKKVYKAVQISLSQPSTPMRAPVQEAAPPAEPSQQNFQRVEEKPAQSAQQKSQPKPQEKPVATVAKKSEPVVEKKAVQTLQKSVDELMAEQRSSRPAQKKEFDWSAFDESATSSSSSTASSRQNVSTPAQNVNALEGTAAQASSDGSSVSKTSTSTNSVDKTASSATSSALKNIVSSTYSSVAGNGVTSTSNIKTASSPDGKIALVMSDGTSRILLEPEKPVITLSPAASATISATVELNISFTVNPDGRVLVNSIKIPSALTSAVVRREIEEQISRWRFSSDTSSATAFFTHRIVKR